MIIIIGAGISGLYLGYLLYKQKRDFIIIEKDKRYGGRVYVDKFLNKKVNLGAGIGRLSKDKILYNLCRELRISVGVYDKIVNYSFNVDIPLLNYVKELKKIKITSKERSNTTFIEFLGKTLKNPEDFTKICGYTDYIHSDIIDTLYDYGFDDNVSGGKAFSVKWQELLDKLYSMLKKHIYLGETVINIDRDRSIVFTDKSSYNYDKLVCSIPVNLARPLFQDIEILEELECQTFSRIYAKISNIPKGLIKSFTIIDSFLQKVIPIDEKEGIYMIGYNDNYCADKAFEYFTTLDEEEVYRIIENEIEKNFGVRVKVEVASIAFWNYGTTYYKPLNMKYKDRDHWLSIAQNPEENLFFIGEGFSKNQGWVEGSLESVVNIHSNL